VNEFDFDRSKSIIIDSQIHNEWRQQRQRQRLPVPEKIAGSLFVSTPLIGEATNYPIS